MEEKSKGEITLKKDALWKAGTFVFAVLFVISLMTGGFGTGDSATGNAAAVPSNDNANNPSAPAPSAVKVSVDDDTVMGSDDAPVTIIEFSDYQCPFCSRFWSQTLPQIKSEYIDTGKVKFVYRDFPLSSIHPSAQKAAEAAECAGEQEKYWEMHDKVFANQQAIDVASLKAYAQQIGLDTAKFNDCLDSGKMTAEVQKDFSDGQAAGVSGTPAFFINGKLVSGAQPFSVFKQAIDAELA